MLTIFFFENSFVFNIVWSKRSDLIRFSVLSYLVSVQSQVRISYLLDFLFSTGTKSSEKNGKKVEKKVFLSIYPGLKSEFSRPKTF